MRTRMLIALLAALPGLVFLIFPSIGAADPAPPVGAHRHFIAIPGGDLVPVGPNICPADNPNPTNGEKQAFYNFHTNVHLGADGLRDGAGAEVIRQLC